MALFYQACKEIAKPAAILLNTFSGKNRTVVPPLYCHDYDIRREEAKRRILKPASVFHYLPSVGPKQLCALAHLGCTREAGTS